MTPTHTTPLLTQLADANAGPRVVRDVYVAPHPAVRIVDDGRVRKLDGVVVLAQADRIAVYVPHVGLLILERGSRHLTDTDALRIAAQPPTADREPRNLQERIERAQHRKIATTHNRVPCRICGALERQRCVHREPGHPPVTLDQPHQERIDADL